jgi:hypothetical protein
MIFSLRAALTAFSLGLTIPAFAQSGSGRWGWAQAPFAAGHGQTSLAQTLDPLRHRVYVLTQLDTAPQFGGVTMPAGFALHTFDAWTGQWLQASSLMLANEGYITYGNLTLDASSGEVVLTGQ